MKPQLDPSSWRLGLAPRASGPLPRLLHLLLLVAGVKQSALAARLAPARAPPQAKVGEALAIQPVSLPQEQRQPDRLGASHSPGPYTSNSDHVQDGTACQCICGDRIVWHRELFAGNVKELKEHECEHDICPYVNIPGLRVTAECTYVKDIRELTAGTLCMCQCGDKAAWVNRGFYGNVTQQKERECLEEICPRVNPLPGLRFQAECRFDPNLFTLHPVQPAHPDGGRPPPQQGAGARPGVISHVVFGTFMAVAAHPGRIIWPR